MLFDRLLVDRHCFFRWVLVEINPSVFGRWLGFQFWFALLLWCEVRLFQIACPRRWSSPKPRPFLELARHTRIPQMNAETNGRNLSKVWLVISVLFYLWLAGCVPLQEPNKVVFVTWFPVWASWRLKILQTIRGCEAQGLPFPWWMCIFFSSISLSVDFFLDISRTSPGFGVSEFFPTKNPSLDGRGFPIRGFIPPCLGCSPGDGSPKVTISIWTKERRENSWQKPPLFFGYLEDHPTYSKRLVIYGGFEPFITKII